jgi:hypothetical protein
MTTESTDAEDYERGYCAGVDHFLPKQGFESQLLAKVSAAFTAIRRRQQTGTTGGRGPVTVDLDSGAHTARHLIGRLNAEMAHAARSAHSLTLLSVCLEGADSAVSSTVSAALLQAVYDAARPRLDWIARLPAPPNACRLAVIMPQAGESEASALQQAVRNVFVLGRGNARLSFGFAALKGAEVQTAVELLSEAERRRRGGDARAHADLRAVQGEVGAPAAESASAA